MRALLVAAALPAAGACTAPPAQPLPQVSDLGGPRMTHPQLVTITFADDTDRAQLEAYSRWIATSRWLGAVGAEYGVGPGAAVAMVERVDNAPDQINDREIEALIARGIGDGSLPRAADGDATNTLYVIHFPAHTTITTGAGGDNQEVSCRDLLAYHSSARLLGVEFAYAAVASCPVPSGLGVNLLELRELATSHELIEAATDPFPGASPAFGLHDRIDPWSATGGEVADLCANDRAFWRESGFLAVRSWSNRVAAERSGDPCVPTTATLPYFDVIANPARPRRVRRGNRARYELSAWSTAPVDPWGLRAVATGTLHPTMTLDAMSINAGRTAVLDVSVPADAVDGARAVIYLAQGHTEQDFHTRPLVVVVGDECGTFTDCESCAAQYACGWCASSGRCENGSRSGMWDGSCRDWAPWRGACPGFCERHNASCVECAGQTGCGWCNAGGVGRCMPADLNGSRSADGTCSGNEWSFVTTYCPAGG